MTRACPRCYLAYYNMTLPPGWVADVGKPYGDRGSGLHFGWNCKEGVSFTRFGAKQGDKTGAAWDAVPLTVNNTYVYSLHDYCRENGVKTTQMKWEAQVRLLTLFVLAHVLSGERPSSANRADGQFNMHGVRCRCPTVCTASRPTATRTPARLPWHQR